MPNLIIGTKHDRPIGIRAKCLCLFTVSPRVTDAAGNEVVPAWDANAIPLSFASEVPAAWRNGILAGDAGWCLVEIDQRVGETVTEFAAYAKTHYAAVVEREIAVRRALAAETGEYDLQRFTLSW